MRWGDDGPCAQARAFDGARFLPGGATVVIDADRIVGVEPAAYVLPPDVPVTEVAGTLLPGLVDCHVHLVASGPSPARRGAWSGPGPPTPRLCTRW